MDIQTEKLGLIEWISKLNDTSILEKLKAVYEESTSTSDWWDDISDAEKESISRGMSDLKEGHIHSHDEVKKLYAKYL